MAGMRNTIIGFMILLATASISIAQSKPEYDPFGVQNDVLLETVLNGGWRILYKGLYRDGMPSVSALFRGSCGKIMLASKKVDAVSFDVLATIETSLFVPLVTPHHATISANGAEWYKNEQSLGFAGLGDVVIQGSADTNQLHERDRLSWHTIRIIGEKDNRLQSRLALRQQSQAGQIRSVGKVHFDDNSSQNRLIDHQAGMCTDWVIRGTLSKPLIKPVDKLLGNHIPVSIRSVLRGDCLDR